MKILLMDSSYLTYESYFAMKNRHLSVEKDNRTIITSSVFGFIKKIIRLTIEESFSFIICAWDSPPYIKKIIFPPYKERKKLDIPSMLEENTIIKALLFDLNIPCLFSTGYEGEEIISSIINRLPVDTNIYSSDEDMYALLSDKVSMINTKEGKINKFTKKELQKKYNVTPKQFVTFKALTGCKSDKIQGVRGIGPEKASWLVNEFSTTKRMKKNIDIIETLKPDIAKKLKVAYNDKSLIISKYLTKICKPKKLINQTPQEKLNYQEILEYLETETLLSGSNLIALKFI